MFHSFDQAKESFEKALAIAKEIGNRKGEAVHCVNLGAVLLFLGEDAKDISKRHLRLQKKLAKGEKKPYVTET